MSNSPEEFQFLTQLALRVLNPDSPSVRLNVEEKAREYLDSMVSKDTEEEPDATPTTVADELRDVANCRYGASASLLALAGGVEAVETENRENASKADEWQVTAQRLARERDAEREKAEKLFNQQKNLIQQRNEAQDLVYEARAARDRAREEQVKQTALSTQRADTLRRERDEARAERDDARADVRNAERYSDTVKEEERKARAEVQKWKDRTGQANLDLAKAQRDHLAEVERLTKGRSSLEDQIDQLDGLLFQIGTSAGGSYAELIDVAANVVGAYRKAP